MNLIPHKNHPYKDLSGASRAVATERSDSERQRYLVKCIADVTYAANRDRNASNRLHGEKVSYLLEGMQLKNY